MKNEHAIIEETIPFVGELGELLLKGREIVRVNRETTEREKVEKERREKAEIESAWSRLREAACRLIPEILHPYCDIIPRETKPNFNESVSVQLPEFGPIEFEFLLRNGEWTRRDEMSFYGYEIQSIRTLGKDDVRYEVNPSSRTHTTTDLALALGYAEAAGKKRARLEIEAAEKNAAEERRRAEEAAEMERRAADAEAARSVPAPDDELIASLVSQALERGLLRQLIAESISAITKEHIDNALLEAIGAN